MSEGNDINLNLTKVIESDFKQTWDFHQASDQLMHSRLSSLMTTQSFLTAAFVLLFNGNLLIPNASRSIVVTVLLCGLCFFGIFLSALYSNAVRSIRKGLDFLKDRMINNNESPFYKNFGEIYANYLISVGEWEKRHQKYEPRSWTKNILPIWIPFSFGILWLFFGIITVLKHFYP